MSASQHIVVFDGVCNLCNGSVNFIIKRDPKNKFVFSAVQGDFAQELINQNALNNVGEETFLVVKGDQFFMYSDAALEIAKNLSGLWPLLYTLKILPKFIRDSLYKAVARNRYKLFGRTDTCMVPTEELRSRFI